MIDESILDFFKEHKDKFLSGEDLSRDLGISRTAIWKHIEKLRSEGYDIAASPHLGYKLVSVPDRLSATELKWGLDTSIVGKRIYSYDKLDSTNELAYKMALDGEEEGSIILSEYQTKGKGRLGRKWVSPKGKGAYFSCILRPDISIRELSLITLISSLAIAKSLREKHNISSLIKWPNDILVEGKKICGILTEMNGEADKVNFIIIGIGININTKKDLLPEEATSIFDLTGNTVDRIDLVKYMFKRLDDYYKVFKEKRIKDIVREYRELSSVLGKHVKIDYNNTIISGDAVDIDTDGALIIRNDSGMNEKIFAGDVTLLR